MTGELNVMEIFLPAMSERCITHKQSSEFTINSEFITQKVECLDCPPLNRGWNGIGVVRKMSEKQDLPDSKKPFEVLG